MSFVKHLKPLTDLAPRPVTTWDKHERIQRNKEIWQNKDSIVHRLPLHYQQNYWKDVLSDVSPVHYRPPKHRFYWDTQQKREIETENFPILPEPCPEQDEGLWGGEGIIKGYKESRPFTRKKVLPRHWVPKLWFPNIIERLLYSEILDKFMRVIVTPRTLRLIDDNFGLDYYLLNTSNIDLASRLGRDLKRYFFNQIYFLFVRHLLIALAKKNYYPDDRERHDYIREKYAKYVIPLEESEWFGLDLNTACRKLQDMEDERSAKPLKYVFEEQLIESLRERDLKILEQEAEDEKFGKPQKSLFGEKLFGKFEKKIKNIST